MDIDLLQIFSKYLNDNPTETALHEPFARFLNFTAGPELFNRKNFAGHITASGFVIDKARQKMLAVHHIVLNRWLQPGGHVEIRDASLIDAALREIEEETGVPPGALRLLSTNPGANVPLDIDSHPIPARPEKGEQAHFHHDWRYLFEYAGDGRLALDETEVKGCAWMELAQLDGFQRISQKIARLP